MAVLHDATYRESLERRLAALRPDAQRAWGKMTVDQMLWHLNVALEAALGRYPVAPMKIPLPGFVIKFLVFNLPWRKGRTPTAPEFVAKQSHVFEHEKARLEKLLDEFAAKPMESDWAHSAAMGQLTGQEWSRLQAKHVDYHLKQFGA